MSLILGIAVFLFLGKKIKTLLVISLLALSAIFVMTSIKNSTILEFDKRVASIFVTKEGGNGARLYMWKENAKFMLDAFQTGNKRLFFMGTGLKNREKLFEQYLLEKTDYLTIREDVRKNVSYMDAHNMYLNILVETGFLYSILFYFFMLYTTSKVLLSYIRTKNMNVLSCLSAMLGFYFCGIFYGFPFTYETSLFFFIMSLGLLEQRSEKENS